MGEPPAGLTGHAGTIAADGSPSVMGITFSARLSRMMGFVARVSSADRYDLVVIGGGSAGLTAADFAARIGAKVLIATEQVGGDCTWTGCIPSKSLIRVARLARDQLHAGNSGIGTGEVKIDFPRVMAEVRGVIARVYSHETPEVLGGRGIEVAIGPVRFVSGDVIAVADRRVSGKHVVICTGAAPAIPPIPGLASAPHLTYETVFDINRLPASMIVLGAGPTGVELAQAFARLGSRVTLIDQRDSVLPGVDAEASAVIQRRLEADGVTVQTSTAVTKVTGQGGRLRLEAGASPIEAESLVVVTGRRPRVTGLGLDQAGVEVRDEAIRVDKYLRTSSASVYAAGDVTGGFQFTHYAGWQGYVAARNALLPGAQEGVRSNPPWAVFTDPEVAQAGLSEAEARAEFSDLKFHSMALDRVDRGPTEGEREGFLKLIANGSGKLVGATAVPRAAGETINELALAIDRGLTVSDLASTIHAYPTFGFAIQQLTAEAAFEIAAAGIRGGILRTIRRRS